MVEVKPNLTSHNEYFLPHHCVFKESSTTTKLRVVFDGSAESSSGVSLNQNLFSGPVVQPELLSIVLKFRTYLIGLSADISKMYRRVSMHAEDRSLQKILWRKSSEELIKEYELTSHIWDCPCGIFSYKMSATIGLGGKGKISQGS
jgi:hypothetical protein